MGLKKMRVAFSLSKSGEAEALSQRERWKCGVLFIFMFIVYGSIFCAINFKK